MGPCHEVRGGPKPFTPCCEDRLFDSELSFFDYERVPEMQGSAATRDRAFAPFEPRVPDMRDGDGDGVVCE